MKKYLNIDLFQFIYKEIYILFSLFCLLINKFLLITIYFSIN